MLSSIANDFAVAARRLVAAPLFSGFAVLSLAFGVGVTTVAYSIVEDLFLPQLAIASPDTFVVLMAPRSGSVSPTEVSRRDFDDLRRGRRSFATVVAASRSTMTVAGEDRTRMVPVEMVSGDYFRAAGVSAELGRVIQPPDEAVAEPVAVIGYAAWREWFAADPQIVGRSIRIAGRQFEIVGVTPPSYTGVMNLSPASQTAVWIPLGAVAATLSTKVEGQSPSAEGESGVSVFGRLARGVSPEAASAEVATIGAALDRSNPLSVMVQGSPRAVPRQWTARRIGDLFEERSANVRPLGFVMAGLVLTVLAVACTNLANLVLARGTMRQQDFAIRRALGASQWRLVREQLAESILLAAAGGAAAYVVMQATAAAAIRDLSLFPGFTLAIRPQVDGSALLVAGTALVLALLVFGLEPAVRLAQAGDVRGPLAATAARMGRTGRYRMLLRWQVGVSTAFFILAALAVRIVIADVRHDPGVQLDGLVVAQLDISRSGWDDDRARRTLQRILDETRRSREVTGVAFSSGLPFGTPAGTARVSPPASVGSPVTTLFITATPEFFDVTGVRIRAGRSLDDRDGASAPPVVVLSESAAATLFGATDPIGQELLMQTGSRDARSAPVTVVGVASDTDTYSYMTSRRAGVVYAPVAQQLVRPLTIVARASGEEALAIAAVQNAIRRADPDLAVVGIGGGWDMLGGPFTLARFASTASITLGGLTLLLAMAGLYGIQSQGVTLRAREIGVRLSFGATVGQIKRMVLREGYRPVFEGLALGLAAGIAGRVIIRAYLDVDLNVLDPWMLVLAPLPLVLAAFCACYLPARRAAAVDPNVALREL